MLRSIRFLFLLCCLLVLSGCLPIQPAAVLASSAAPSPPAAPYFLHTACLYRIPAGADVTCGYLVVPEDRSQPDGKTIRLHVVIFKSASAAPQPDPLILLNGGPGSPGQPMVESILYDLLGEVWRAEREVIYFDQRGTGFALPSLYCPETALPAATVAAMPYAAAMAAETNGLRHCYERLTAEGINLAAYTLAESAADVNDLRLALGYEQVNLYGFSYGSLLATAVMRTYPTTLRSVILDSVLPPGIDLVQAKPGCLQSGIDALLAGCAADAACHTAYPELATHFYTILDRLAQSPVTVTVTTADATSQVVVDDLKFLNYLFFQLQNGLISTLPRQIETLFAGNYEAPAQRWLTYATAQATPASRLTQATAYGMYYATLCNYTAGLATGEPAPCAPCAAPTDQHPSLAAYADFMLAPCTFWQAGAAPMALTRPLSTSAIPTLFLTGAYDCALPPSLSQGLTATLDNSYHFVLPVSHAVAGSLCGLYLTDQFLAAPTVRPDATCIDRMTVEWSTR